MEDFIWIADFKEDRRFDRGWHILKRMADFINDGRLDTKMAD